MMILRCKVVISKNQQLPRVRGCVERYREGSDKLSPIVFAAWHFADIFSRKWLGDDCPLLLLSTDNVCKTVSAFTVYTVHL